MKHLKKAINILAQEIEREVQTEYPIKKFEYPAYGPEDISKMPLPVGYVYHVSPYAENILEEGFIIDPTKTVLGAFGPSETISTTSIENARLYKESIEMIVGTVNGELDWRDIFALACQHGTDMVGVKHMLAHVMEEKYAEFIYHSDYHSIFDLLKKRKEEGIEPYTGSDAAAEIEAFRKTTLPEMAHGMKVRDFFDSWQGESWLFDMAVSKRGFGEEELSVEDDLRRKWIFLKGIAYSTDLPAIIGIDPPEHLKERKMSDVGIIEVAVAPVEYETESWRGLEKEPKGTYTFVPGEQEWRFYDVTDLWPVRIVATNNLKQAINLLAEAVPPPPEYVYHTTPYTQEILQEGFEIDPERQTLGGHGTYISTTTQEEATKYADDLKIVIGFLNGELDWKDLYNIFDNLGLTQALNSALANVTINEFWSLKRYSEIKKEGFTEEEITDFLPEGLTWDNMHSEGSEWMESLYVNGLDFQQQPITEREEIKRRWEVISAIASYAPSIDSFVLLMGVDPPQHLLDKSMEDVGVLEVAVAPSEAYSEFGYVGIPKEPKGQYTYNPSEKEWRFYDPTDLLPVRVVA